eukprot:COSAG02_NODE_527_length_20704_cov_120.745462_2_plen_151_part_00
MEERTTHRSVRERSQVAVPARSAGPARQVPAIPSSSQEVQLLYERVERLAEQASIAQQLQQENDELQAELRELRGEARALRRENAALKSQERVDASDMVPICLRLASLGLSCHSIAHHNEDTLHGCRLLPVPSSRPSTSLNARSRQTVRR